MLGEVGYIGGSMYNTPNRPQTSIRRGEVLTIQDTNIWSYTPHLSTCNLLAFSSSLELGRSYLGELGSLEEEQLWYEYYEEFFHSLVLISSI